jgi:hypothetical protein
MDVQARSLRAQNNKAAGLELRPETFLEDLDVTAPGARFPKAAAGRYQHTAARPAGPNNQELRCDECAHA